MRLALLQIPQNSLAWSSTLQLSNDRITDIDDPAVKACINLVVNVAVDQFSKLNGNDSGKSLASSLCRSGIAHLFRLGKVNFETADALFSRAFDIEPRGIYLAWRAYVRTFLVAELQYTNRETVDEAFDFMHRALAMEPYNSYVAALSAHVHSITRRSDAAAYELAERSIQLNNANPLGWAVIGVAETYLGRVSDGCVIRCLLGTSPDMHRIAINSRPSASLQVRSRVKPIARSSWRKLATRWRRISRRRCATFRLLYAYKGEHERSYEMVRKLQRNEPDFTLSRLRDKTYPAWALHRTPIIASLPKRQV